MSLVKSKYIETLIQAGADAMKNLYYVKFIRLDKPLNATETSGLMVREGNLSLPTFSHPVVTNKFMTVSSDFPKPEIQGEKKLSVKFRVDSNYKVYEMLKDWQGLHTKPTIGYVNPDISTEELQVEVYSVQDTGKAVDAKNNATLLYRYKYCWVDDVNGLSYSYDNTGAQSVTVNMYFCDMDDIQNL